LQKKLKMEQIIKHWVHILILTARNIFWNSSLNNSGSRVDLCLVLVAKLKWIIKYAALYIYQVSQSNKMNPELIFVETGLAIARGTLISVLFHSWCSRDSGSHLHTYNGWKTLM
jgi:hypothetical protein